MIRNLLAVVTLLVFFGGCKKIFKDDRLSIPQTHYTGSQLRTDGFYYERLANTYIVYLFYRNGTVMGGQSFDEKTLDSIEVTLLSERWISAVKDRKYNWGRFLIEADDIQFEKWYPGGPPIPAYVREGKILNDTTFVITETYRKRNGKKTEISPGRNEVYHFKQFSPKPDSTNRFVQ